jgi:transcriptional regulator with XRE-family HTH domain
LNGEQANPNRHQLARALKAIRRDADVSGERLAAALGWSQSKVSKIENGRTRPSPEDVQAWLDRFEVSQEHRRQLLHLAEAAQTEATTWRSIHGQGFDRRQRHYADLEAAASRLSIYQPAMVPGLFQTADYARRVLTMLRTLMPTEMATALSARLDRQAILYDETKTIDAVITEAALRWRPGPSSLALAQLDRLTSLMTLPNVHIGVLPTDSESEEIPLNQFVIFHLSDGTDSVLVETYTAEVSIADPEGVATYQEIFKHHQAAALYDDSAIKLVQAIAHDLRGRL